MIKMDQKEHIYHEKNIKDDDDDSLLEGSTGSSLSSCSSDSMEDVTSSSSNGPLYELSDLLAQLPIKKGLSKYYQGKSQTFTSLSSVKSLEDLVKRKRPSKKRTIVSCKSYGGGLDHHIFSPKAVISKKKDSRISFFSTSKINRSGKVFTDSGIDSGIS